MWLYLIKHKYDISHIFSIFKSLVENQLSTKIKIFYSYNGGEYLKLRYFFFQTHEITCLITLPYIPKHNGLSKRKHRHLVETARCLLYHTSLPISFWSYVLETTTYLINRMPTLDLNMKSPLEFLFHSSPNYSKLRTYECLYFPWLVPYVHNKLLPKSQPCIFLGHNKSQSAYLCYNFKTKKLYTSRHMHFVENVFPYSSGLATTSSLSPTSIPMCMQPSGPTPLNHI